MNYLLQNSDEEHPITVNQMIQYLESNGIAAERKSIYDDIEALRTFGMDIEECKRGRVFGYYVASRTFELPELKLLVDSVQSSKFITHKKTASLIKKIETLASVHSAQLLHRQVFVKNRIKTMNESIYYNVDEIHNGISNNRKIRFLYFEYNVAKERQYRHGGAYYVVSPFAMTWDDENYYLVAYDSEAGIIKHYRVDKMEKISTLDEERDGQEVYQALDMAVYAGSATLFLLTASFPLLMWVLMLVNLVPGFSVEGVAELLADFLPQIPEIQTAILGLLQNLSGQSAQFVASLAVLTTIVSASGGMNALQIGLQRLTPGSHRTFLNRLLAIGYTFVFELLLLVMLALQGMHSLFTRFADTLPLFRHYAAIVAPLQRVASIGRIVSVPLLFGLLLLIYTYVPGGRRTPRSQLPGTIFATAGWLVFSRVFSFYILHFWRLSYIYGSLTAVILIILWLYVIINLLFIGAGINAEMNGKTEQ